jgi:hypothetical protein
MQQRSSLFGGLLLSNQKNNDNDEDEKEGDESDLLTLAEEALPQVLSSKSLWSRILSELKTHHRWFAVIYKFSKLFPRPLRIVSLATNIVIMLFVQSITYDLTHGDESLCLSYKTADACLEPQSAYNTNSNMCYWSNEENACHFIEPANEVKVTIFVAIFSALVATPIAVFCDWLILNVLVAPTAIDAVEVSKNDNSQADLALAPIVPASAPHVKRSSAPIIPAGQSSQARHRSRSKRNQSLTVLLPFAQSLKSEYRAQAESEMNQLVEEIVEYRKKLTIQERKDFDGKLTLN